MMCVDTRLVSGWFLVIRSNDIVSSLEKNQILCLSVYLSMLQFFCLLTIYDLFACLLLQVPTDQPCVALDMIGSITQSPATWSMQLHRKQITKNKNRINRWWSKTELTSKHSNRTRQGTVINSWKGELQRCYLLFGFYSVILFSCHII